MELYLIYHNGIPPFLDAYAHTPVVKRLQKIGMNCGCEYTAFPLFRRLGSYSRYDHSLGVALIVWHFTQSRAQAVSGLLHDIATPVFAHVVDFMNGDYLIQESTEAGTGEIIAGSPDLQDLLKLDALGTYDVCDYHRYPIADNDSPLLSADRLEYTLGNLLNYGICSFETVKEYYADLTVGINEWNREELMFRTRETAESFALAALKCSIIYVSEEDRYSMQILSELLQYALAHHVLEPADLYTTEYCSLSRMIQADVPGSSGEWRRICAKKRCIDPKVSGYERVSRFSPSFRDALNTFLHKKQDEWLCGVTVHE